MALSAAAAVPSPSRHCNSPARRAEASVWNKMPMREMPAGPRAPAADPRGMDIRFCPHPKQRSRALTGTSIANGGNGGTTNFNASGGGSSNACVNLTSDTSGQLQGTAASNYYGGGSGYSGGGSVTSGTGDGGGAGGAPQPPLR